MTAWLSDNAGWLAIVVPVFLWLGSLIFPVPIRKRRLRLDLEILNLAHDAQLAPWFDVRDDLQKELEIVLRPKKRPWWLKRIRALRYGQLWALGIALSLFWLASLSWHTKDAAFWFPAIPGAYLVVAAVHDFVWFSCDRYRLSIPDKWVEHKFLLPGDYYWVRTIEILRREKP